MANKITGHTIYDRMHSSGRYVAWAELPDETRDHYRGIAEIFNEMQAEVKSNTEMALGDYADMTMRSAIATENVTTDSVSLTLELEAPMVSRFHKTPKSTDKLLKVIAEKANNQQEYMIRIQAIPKVAIESEFQRLDSSGVVRPMTGLEGTW